MRAFRSPAFGAVVAVLAVMSLAACVPSATPKTADTLAPLSLPVPTVAVVTLPVTPVIETTLVDPAVTLATLATAATTAQPATSATTTTATAAGAPNSTPSTYTVVAQDTLSGIGRRCAITPQAVADDNAWSDGIAHPIYPGTVVKLPCTPTASVATGASTATTTTVKGASAPSTTIAPGPGGLYTVVAGDYLAGIAAKTGTTVNGIVQVNGWADGTNHLIIAGQQIKLPAKTK